MAIPEIEIWPVPKCLAEEARFRSTDMLRTCKGNAIEVIDAKFLGIICADGADAIVLASVTESETTKKPFKFTTIRNRKRERGVRQLRREQQLHRRHT